MDQHAKGFVTAMTPPTTGGLVGRNLLIVEDEYFLADDMRAALEQNGATVIGPVGDLDDARAILDGDMRIDAAVLDINLHGEAVFPLANTLRELGIPFVFATGYSEAAIPSEFAAVPRWEKPYSFDDLVEALPGLVRPAETD